MTYPMELWENTRLEHTIYPFQLFPSHQYVKKNDCILHLHWHEHFEIIVMRRGRILLHIDSQPYMAVAGDVVIIPGGSLHVGYSLDDGDVNYDCVVLNASLFNDWMHDPVHVQYVSPYLEGRQRFPVKPADHDEVCTSYYHLLDEVIVELSAKAPAYQLVVKSKLHALFTLLSRTFIPLQSDDKPAGVYFPNYEGFKSLIQRVETNLSERMTIKEAAKVVSLNPYYFCKSFKRLTGRTFIEYVNICRMKEAKRLLLESNDSITEIASKVGCENPNYFTKLYKKYMGMTPSMTRRS